MRVLKVKWVWPEWLYRSLGVQEVVMRLGGNGHRPAWCAIYLRQDCRPVGRTCQCSTNARRRGGPAPRCHGPGWSALRSGCTASNDRGTISWTRRGAKQVWPGREGTVFAQVAATHTAWNWSPRSAGPGPGGSHGGGTLCAGLGERGRGNCHERLPASPSVGPRGPSRASVSPVPQECTYIN